MPNWVQTKLTFHGKSNRVNKLLETVKSESDGEVNYFDLDRIMPMPESLKIESGSSTDLAIDILKYQETGDDTELKEKLKYPWVVKEGITTIEQFIEHCTKNEKVDLDNGRKALENIQKWGSKDWYEWSIKNWGTKWNTSDSYYEGDTLSFQTAWSLPESVLIKLSEMFPDITICVVYADEDIGSNCGEFQLVNGNIENYIEYDGIQACEVWGYDPADYFPSVIRDRRIDDILNNEEEN
jgi:hypothetical protein